LRVKLLRRLLRLDAREPGDKETAMLYHAMSILLAAWLALVGVAAFAHGSCGQVSFKVEVK
jgi:hypothetical protein